MDIIPLTLLTFIKKKEREKIITVDFRGHG